MSARGRGTRRPGPIYRQLPKGPHGLSHRSVVHDQRTRMHGAMIEAIARRGYKQLAVADVIGLAGVSRRAFYEQFTGKEDCFLQTLDLITGRLACRMRDASEGVSSEDRVRVALRVLMGELRENPKILRLVLIDALAAGLEARLRLCRLFAAAERALAVALPDAQPPMVRMAVGGVYRALTGRLQTGRLEATLEGRLLDWLLLCDPLGFDAPAAPLVSPSPTIPQLAITPDMAYRQRLEAATINLLQQPCEELSGLRIADEAGVSLDVFLDTFLNPQECLTAAVNTLAQGVLESVGHPDLVSSEWPRAVRDAIDRLAGHLAANPACATILTTRIPMRDMMLLADEIALLLTEGAPHPSRLSQELVSGALARTLQVQVTAGHLHELEALTGHASYMVLAAYLGAEAVPFAVFRWPV
jgi:AcrR family transcriptional regulator